MLSSEFLSHGSSSIEPSQAEEEEEGVTLALNTASTKEVDFLFNLTEPTTIAQEVTTTTLESTASEENIGFEQTSETGLLASTESSSPTAKLQTTTVTRNGNLTTSEIHIDLPIYLPNSSETPESFLKFYSSEMHTILIDDEETDITVADDYKRMGVDDFNLLTEFPLTTEAGVKGLGTESEAQKSTSASENPTTPPHKQEKTSDAGLIIPGDLQHKYIPNGCSASDYQNANGCFCVVDEILRRLNHALHDKDLSQKVDSFQCGSFFKVKEGLLINNATVESRVKRSYMFVKHQQNLEVVKRETIPYNEIERVLKATTNIQNTGKGSRGKNYDFVTALYFRFKDLCCAWFESGNSV